MTKILTIRPVQDYQHQLVLSFMELAKQETPDAPTVPSLEVRQLRARLILEEAFEVITDGLALAIDLNCDIRSNIAIRDIEFNPIGCSTPNLSEIADGCADLKVVTVGTEIACGINGKPIFEEVMRSNFTKFIDGHMREDGKWQKGPSYEPPNLEPILKAQGMK